MATSAAALDFGQVQVNAVAPPQTLQISNQGGAAMELDVLKLRGESSADYMLVNTCPAMLEAGESCAVRVTVQPSVAGVREASLVIGSSSARKRKSIALSTTGFDSSAPIRTSLAQDSFSGSVLSSRWTPSNGLWTQNNNLYSPLGTTGWNTYIQYDSYYATQQRNEAVDFTFHLPGTVMGVGSAIKPVTPGSPITTSMFTVDASTNTLNVMNAWVSGSTPTLLASTPVQGGILLERKYTLVIRVHYRKVNLTLTDSVTGRQTVLIAGSNLTDRGYGYQSDEWGNFTDYPVFVAAAGQFSVSQFSIYAETQYPRVMFVGDSITEGFGVLLAQSWPQLVGGSIEPFVTAGRSGGFSAGAVAQMESEVQFMQPQYLVVFIGTNDFDTNLGFDQFKQNIDSIVAKAPQCGSQLVLATLLPNGYGVPAQYNNYLESLSVPLIRFDLAMSRNGDGVTYDPTLSQDGTHPNVNGNIAMAARVLADVPQLSR